MICFSFSLFLCVASAVFGHALPRDAAVPDSSSKSRLARFITEKRAPFKDMSLRNFYVNSFDGGTSSTENRRITFHLDDPNSNSSTCCNTSWTESDNSTTAPTSYVLCDITGREERFRWYFESFTSLSNFTLQLAHAYEDPIHFPPPYEAVEIFATVDIILSCVENNGLQGCYLPPGTLSVNAPINAAIN